MMLKTFAQAPHQASQRSGVQRIQARPLPLAAPRRHVIAAAAQEDPDAELEKRLENLRKAKGATPYGQSKTRAKKEEGAAPGAGPSKPVYDYSNEKVHFEGAPATGDLVLNLALGTTLVWLPLTLAAVGRCSFVKYRFTDRRVSVQATAPWKQEQTDIAYQEVKEVVTVGRAFGAWGDMVITLNNGDKIELRSLEKYKELKDYVLSRRDALAPANPASSGSGRPKGAALTAAELMGETEPKKKGFA